MNFFREKNMFNFNRCVCMRVLLFDILNNIILIVRQKSGGHKKKTVVLASETESELGFSATQQLMTHQAQQSISKKKTAQTFQITRICVIFFFH